MPPKKHGRGVKNKGKGRPKSADKTEPDSEEEREKNRLRQAEHRGQDSTPKKKTERYPSSAQLSLNSPSASKKRMGRPPGNPSGSETPNTRRLKNTESHQRSRHTAKVTRVRSEAAKAMWERKRKAEGGGSSTESDLETDAGPRRLDFGDETGDDGDGGDLEAVGDDDEINADSQVVEKSSRTIEKPIGSLKRAYYYGKLAILTEAFHENTRGRYENIDVCVRLLKHGGDVINLDKMEIKIDYEMHYKYEQYSSVDVRTIQRKATAIRQVLRGINEPEIVLEDMLLATLMSQSVTAYLLQQVGVVVPDHLLPKFQLAAKMYVKAKNDLMNKRTGSDADRFLCNKAALATAKEAHLSVANHGDVQILRRAIGSSWEYANRILKAIEEGKEESLFERATRKDAIKASEWPQRLAEFAKLPSNSRGCPGKETISIAYGVRVPKYLLVKKKKDVLQSFLTINEGCTFGAKTLDREWPQNVVTPTSRDLQRNVCPIHANARRLQTCLKKNLDVDIPTSVRLMCASSICVKPGCDVLDPLTWDANCVDAKCRDCPQQETYVSPDMRDVQLRLALWGTKVDEVKGKPINALHEYVMTFGEVADRFDKFLPKLVKHVYNAAVQWDREKMCREEMEELTVTTVEDYQQNILLTHSEETTTSHYTANQVQLALFPVSVSFRLPGEEKPRKGGICYITSDRIHDFSQVELFEANVFTFLKERYNLTPKVWHR